MKPHDSNSRSSRPSTESRSEGHAKEREEDAFAEGDPLWDLLGRTREVEVSPFFARNVVRAARLEADRPARGLSGVLRLLFGWRAMAATAAAFAIALVAATSLSQQSEWNHGAVAAFSQDDRIIDFDIIKNLDELLAMEESSEETALWLNVSQP